MRLSRFLTHAASSHRKMRCVSLISQRVSKKSTHSSLVLSIRSRSTSATTSKVPSPTSASLSVKNNATKVKSLEIIPGVGPKTASLFHEQGILSVEQLNAKIKQDCVVPFSCAEKLADYLKHNVGVRHRRHAHLIAEFMLEYTNDTDGPPVTVSVEGNISVGKSTLMRHMMDKRNSRMSAVTEFLLEPVERWQDVRGHNVLEAFYSNPERYAYTFQSFVFLTRLLESATPSHLPQRLLERSVFSDSMVFLRAIHNAEWLSDMEFELLTTYFNPLCSKFPQIVPNGFIYLRADPEVCYDRLRFRNREEESTVSLSYLQQLHEYHEQWFEPIGGSEDRSVSVQFSNDGMKPSQFNNTYDYAPLIADNSSKKFSSKIEIPDLIRENVVLLKGRDGFSIFEQIPTLVLDCDEDGVLSQEARDDKFVERSVMVECFFEYLRKLQRCSSENGQQNLGNRNLFENQSVCDDSHILTHGLSTSSTTSAASSSLRSSSFSSSSPSSISTFGSQLHTRKEESIRQYASSSSWDKTMQQRSSISPSPLQLNQDDVAQRLLDQLMGR